MIRRWVEKVANTAYVRQAMASRADLTAFREKPAPVVLAGVFAMGASYVVGWPLIAFLGYISVRFSNPWIITVGGPAAYGLSHLVFMLGMFLSGRHYGPILMRWLTRITVERLLLWTHR